MILYGEFVGKVDMKINVLQLNFATIRKIQIIYTNVDNFTILGNIFSNDPLRGSVNHKMPDFDLHIIIHSGFE